jgi:hypothetical protein
VKTRVFTIIILFSRRTIKILEADEQVRLRVEAYEATALRNVNRHDPHLKFLKIYFGSIKFPDNKRRNNEQGYQALQANERLRLRVEAHRAAAYKNTKIIDLTLDGASSYFLLVLKGEI